MTLTVSELAPLLEEVNHAEAVMIDPLERDDWDSLVLAHPQSTIFHSRGWARVLRDTYGHRPVYFARFDGARLVELLPVMEVSSWLTGRRGVSLPFSDFCSSLNSSIRDDRTVHQKAIEHGRRSRWKVLECRSLDEAWDGAKMSIAFYGHAIRLEGGRDKLFKRLDGAARRGVRKAEQAGVKIDFDHQEESMQTFYALHCRTRRRHGLPPQPWRFFLNIQRHLLSSGQGFIATARLGVRPLAAAVFLCHGRQALFKFGASDDAFQQMRPNNLVMWAALERCAEQGLTTLNLGRTSLSNAGLRRFKLGFGAEEQAIHYAKFDFSTEQFVKEVDHVEGWFNRVFARLPLPVLRLSGAVLYPHLS